MAGDRAMVERALTDRLIARVERALRTRRAVAAVDDGSYRHAAVALVLRAGEITGEPEVLLIRRATWEGDPWSGQMALPGGRSEPGDATLEATAVRETREETAVDLDRSGRILGRLDDLQPRTRVLPRIIITPVVAVFGGPAALTPSSEVAAAFWAPLAALRDPGASRDATVHLPTGALLVPSIQYGGHTIWGLTERILRAFLALSA